MKLEFKDTPFDEMLPIYGKHLTRKENLLFRYGLSFKEYENMLESQNFSCKICQVKSEDNRFGCLFVDHDHKTGKIRGLLCQKCNMLLGCATDNPTILLKAIQYIKGNL